MVSVKMLAHLRQLNVIHTQKMQEMLGVLSQYSNDWETTQSILRDPMSWMDRQILGNRMNSPVLRNWMLKLVRDSLSMNDPEDDPENEAAREDYELEQSQQTSWLPQDPERTDAQWYPVLKAGHTVEHLVYNDRPRHWAGQIRIDGKEMTYAAAHVRYLKPIRAKEKDMKKLVDFFLQGLDALEERMAKAIEDRGWTTRTAFTKRYGFSVPCREVLNWVKEIVSGRKVVEIAAGMGLWTLMFKAMGLEAYATDLRSDAVDWGFKTPFVPVLDMDGVAVVKAAKTSPVFFTSWLPMKGAWQGHMLQAMKPGSDLIVVGEEDGGCTGSPEFWAALSDFQIVSHQFLPNWEGICDYAVHYRKKEVK